jgi:hypothetical protein
MKEVLRVFNIEDVSEETHGTFTELSHTDEFRNTDCFGRQVLPAIEYVQYLSIPFSDIGMIVKHDRCARRGRPSCMDEVTWQHLQEIVVQHFELQCPITTGDVLDSLSVPFDLHLLPNTLGKKVHQDRELPMITGIPREKERLECDFEEIRVSFELSTASQDEAHFHGALQVMELGSSPCSC